MWPYVSFSFEFWWPLTAVSPCQTQRSQGWLTRTLRNKKMREPHILFYCQSWLCNGFAIDLLLFVEETPWGRGWWMKMEEDTKKGPLRRGQLSGRGSPTLGQSPALSPLRPQWGPPGGTPTFYQLLCLPVLSWEHPADVSWRSLKEVESHRLLRTKMLYSLGVSLDLGPRSR